MKRYRDEPVLMKCGHPRAAREIVIQEDGRFRTECWACRIEREKAMTETVEERIEREVAAGMRLHNLKQAGERLRKVRTQLKDIRGLLEDDKPLADEIGRIIVNEIETLMWKIEMAVIEQVKPKQEGK